MACLKKIEKTLHEFCKVGLKPNDAILSDGIKNAQMVFKLLQRRSKYSLNRFIIGGSIGKRTTVSHIYDFDLVIFVNNVSPPFDKILEDFEDVLLSCEQDILVVSKTENLVQFTIDEFEYDLLVGVNFINESNRTGDWIIEEQRNRVLEKIREDPRKAYTYSTSLVESQVGFMKKQSAFVHELVRLSKFWNKTVYISGYISGRSTVIELIAVHAGQNEEKNSNISIFAAFKTFLKLVKGIENMDINFDGIKPAIQMSKPLLLEPANPYNNLLYSWKSSTKKLFCKHAKESLARLEEFCNEPDLDHFPLEDFFGAQIDPGMFSSLTIGKRLQDTLVGSVKVSREKARSMEVRNYSLDNYQIHRVQKIIESFVFTNITAVTNNNGNSNLTSDQVTKIVEEQLNKSIFREISMEWETADDEHEEFDMTFTIPYQIEGEQYEVKLSFNADSVK